MPDPQFPLVDGTEPLDRIIKLRLSRRQLVQLDQLVAELDIARAWLVRQSIAVGLPLVLERYRQAFKAGLVVSGTYRESRRRKPMRGPRLDGDMGVHWRPASTGRPGRPRTPGPSYERD